jgi:hypothetical protein
MKNKFTYVFSFFSGVFVIVLAQIIINSIGGLSTNKISATGRYHSFNLPQNLSDDLENFKYDDINIAKELPELNSNENANDLSRLMKLYLQRNSFVSQLTNLVYNVNSYWEFEINNKGSNEVRDLILDLQSSGLYSIKAGTLITSGKYTDKINVGSIRPSSNIQISVWSNDYVNNDNSIYSVISNTENIKLTYPNGIVKITYPLEATGILRFFAGTSFYSFFSTILIIIILFLLIGVYYYGSKSFVLPKRGKKSNPHL